MLDIDETFWVLYPCS